MATSNVIQSGRAPLPAHRSLAEQRAGVIFDQITSLSEVVARLGVLCIENQNDDERDMMAFHEAIKALAAQIGLLGDFGAGLTGGMQLHGPDIAKWLLPPIYPDASEAEAIHG
jgi:hypothetical protein